MADAPAVEVVVGVVVVGHAHSASALVTAAEGILGAPLSVIAVDAGAGEDADLRTRMCDAVAAADQGAGVLLLADMFGSSPCACGMRIAAGHPLAVLAGLNLAMLLKLATLDRATRTPAELAEACADSARRAITVIDKTSPTTTSPPPPEPASRKELA
jgi:PTS system mannose-specific IIA component